MSALKREFFLCSMYLTHAALFIVTLTFREHNLLSKDILFPMSMLHEIGLLDPLSN